MLKRTSLSLLPLIALAVWGCNSSSITVEFKSTPHLSAPDKVMLGDVTIGRVVGLSPLSRGSRVTLIIDSHRLPQRAIFLATTDSEGHRRLDMFPLSDYRDASPGVYWGVTNEAELAAQLGAERARQVWSDLRGWVLNSLSGPQRPDNKSER
jgi:hypothetical protein